MSRPILAVEYEQGIEDAFTSVTTFVPKLIGFLLVLIIGYFIVKAIAKIAEKALERVGFDKAVERGGIKQALSKSKYDASDIVGKIVFYALFLFVLQLAFGVFGNNPISDLITGVIAYLPKVLAAIIIIVIASAVAAAAKTLIEASLGGLSYGKILANVGSIFILGFGVFAALNQLQIAPEIVTGLFYAILAIIVGSSVIAIGGSGVTALRPYWEKALKGIEDEAPNLRQASQGSKERIAQKAQEVGQQARSAAGGDTPPQQGSSSQR